MVQHSLCSCSDTNCLTELLPPQAFAARLCLQLSSPSKPWPCRRPVLCSHPEAPGQAQGPCAQCLDGGSSSSSSGEQKVSTLFSLADITLTDKSCRTLSLHQLQHAHDTAADCMPLGAEAASQVQHQQPVKCSFSSQSCRAMFTVSLTGVSKEVLARGVQFGCGAHCNDLACKGAAAVVVIAIGIMQRQHCDAAQPVIRMPSVPQGHQQHCRLPEAHMQMLHAHISAGHF
jgi:hypothetical protein